MRKILATLAAGTVMTSAVWGQNTGSAITIYGIVDAGAEYARTSAGSTTPAASLKSLVTGSQSASRLGFRISEDLGSDLRASAMLEHGFDVDTGGVTGSVFWSRDSYVGLGGGWGELRLGRTYTPGFWVLINGDINRLGFYGNAGGFARLGPTGQTRAANGINYISPSTSGFVLRATYAFGESASAPTDAGRVVGVAGEYNSGPLYVGLFHHSRRDVFPASSTTSAETRFSGGSVKYDLSTFSFAAGVARFDPAGADTATAGVTDSWWLGLQIKTEIGEFRVTGGRLKMAASTGTQPRGTMIGASYNYPLSRRTSLYTTLGLVDNNSAGRFVLEASSRAVALPVSAGTDTRGLAAGIRHTF